MPPTANNSMQPWKIKETSKKFLPFSNLWWSFAKGLLLLHLLLKEQSSTSGICTNASKLEMRNLTSSKQMMHPMESSPIVSTTSLALLLQFASVINSILRASTSSQAINSSNTTPPPGNYLALHIHKIHEFILLWISGCSRKPCITSRMKSMLLFCPPAAFKDSLDGKTWDPSVFDGKGLKEDGVALAGEFMDGNISVENNRSCFLEIRQIFS